MMRTVLAVVLLVFGLAACGGKDEGGEPPVAPPVDCSQANGLGCPEQ